MAVAVVEVWEVAGGGVGVVGGGAAAVAGAVGVVVGAVLAAAAVAVAAVFLPGLLQRDDCGRPQISTDRRPHPQQPRRRERRSGCCGYHKPRR